MRSDFFLNKKNQGSSIKTIKSHDSILVPLLGRGVFTAGFAPPMPQKRNMAIPRALDDVRFFWLKIAEYIYFFLFLLTKYDNHFFLFSLDPTDIHIEKPDYKKSPSYMSTKDSI